MKNSVEMVKRGIFYYCYDKDAILLHDLMGYKIVMGTKRIGFPISNLERVINRLEDLKISYQVIENKEVIKQKEFNKANRYNHYYEIALPKMQIENRFAILEEEIKQLDNKEILRILKLVEDEVRK